MKTFRLEAMSPDRDFYSGECASLTVPLHDGSYGIMAGHAPLTAAVVPGEATIVAPSGKRIVCAVSQGIVDAGRNGVRLLCESILLPEEIDEEAEIREAEAAAEDMKGKQSYKDYMLSQLMLAKALNNLRVKKREMPNLNNE